MIRSLLHDINPYENFESSQYTSDAHGWNVNPGLFETLVEQIKPTLAIEVGSWYGKSAILIADALKKHNCGELLCIDTWLGAREMWTENSEDTGLNLKNHDDRYERLQLKNGFPQFYYNFLSNIVRAGHEDIVTPFPQTSVIAARWLKSHKIKSQLIYIDASHEYDDVLSDLKSYWEVLATKGIMFGDDWNFPDVQKAVLDFSRDKRMHPTLHESDGWTWWSLQK